VSSEFLFSGRALTKDPRPNALRLSLSRISIARKLAIGSVVIAVAQTMGVRCFRARAEDVGAEAGSEISTLVIRKASVAVNWNGTRRTKRSAATM
jgi:hypothetical protein